MRAGYFFVDGKRDVQARGGRDGKVDKKIRL
jgi:hypothetical protein